PGGGRPFPGRRREAARGALLGERDRGMSRRAILAGLAACSLAACSLAGVSLAGASPAAAQSLVLALSTEEVLINSNFTGAGLTVFTVVQGAPEADLQNYDLAVVLRGPPGDFVTRRKDRVLGLWIN